MGYELDPSVPDAVAFHRWWYDSDVVSRLRWRGVPIGKCPMDLVAYQEIIHATRPQVLVETGTNYGGSALFFAEQLGPSGVVVTVDAFPHPVGEPEYRRPLSSGRDHTARIVYVTGDSASEAVRQTVVSVLREYRPERVMVVLDSRHDAGHVARELALYAMLVTPGCYLVVEDTNVNGHPVLPSHGPGPAEALEEWLPTHPEFVPEPVGERLGLTMHPGGWLRRLPDVPEAA